MINARRYRDFQPRRANQAKRQLPQFHIHKKIPTKKSTRPIQYEKLIALITSAMGFQKNPNGLKNNEIKLAFFKTVSRYCQVGKLSEIF